MLSNRIKQLRDQSLDAVNHISPERAQLVTQFYKSDAARGLSVPMQRARCFEYILSRKEIYTNVGEWIVGERGPAPKATPTYPEITVHSLQDLDILNSRPKVSFKVDEETRTIYDNEIIPFWKGKTNRDRVMHSMSNEWHLAYEAGIFTEFQEQRAPGHTVAGYKVFQTGMLDYIEQIKKSISCIDYQKDPLAFSKKEELDAMAVSASALILWANRYADRLEEMAKLEANPELKDELLYIATICRNVPANKPATFHEALQHYWFVHLGVVTELNPWDSFNPGRLDQHLYPFYKKEITECTLTEAKARELLQSFWIKFNNHPAPPKIGVTALESNTYTDFALINLGGVKSDGSDAVNDLTYLILDVIEEMRLLQPSSMIQVSKKNPDAFIARTLKILKTGFRSTFYFQYRCHYPGINPAR
jgi:trans-4-hydroxy-L-proline dehydratase